MVPYGLQLHNIVFKIPQLPQEAVMFSTLSWITALNNGIGYDPKAFQRSVQPSSTLFKLQESFKLHNIKILHYQLSSFTYNSHP